VSDATKDVDRGPPPIGRLQSRYESILERLLRPQGTSGAIARLVAMPMIEACESAFIVWRRRWRGRHPVPSTRETPTDRTDRSSEAEVVALMAG
jgi:hypothetical protein